MKTYPLTTALLIGLLTMSAAPLNSYSKDGLPSRHEGQSEGHHQSGVSGQSVIQGPPVRIQIDWGLWTEIWQLPVPYETTVSAYSESGESVVEVSTDEDGYFEMFLKPGNYTLVASPPTSEFQFPEPFSHAGTTIVTVEKKQFVSEVVLFSRYGDWSGFPWIQPFPFPIGPSPLLPFPTAMQTDDKQGHHLKSGIVGQAYVLGFWDGLNGLPPEPTPIQTHVTVYSLPPVRKNDPLAFGLRDGKYVTDIESDEDGSFVVDLKPGRYLIVPDPLQSLTTSSAIVEVEKKEYTTANVYYGVMFH